MTGTDGERKEITPRQTLELTVAFLYIVECLNPDGTIKAWTSLHYLMRGEPAVPLNAFEFITGLLTEYRRKCNHRPEDSYDTYGAPTMVFLETLVHAAEKTLYTIWHTKHRPGAQFNFDSEGHKMELITKIEGVSKSTRMHHMWDVLERMLEVYNKRKTDQYKEMFKNYICYYKTGRYINRLTEPDFNKNNSAKQSNNNV